MGLPKTIRFFLLLPFVLLGGLAGQSCQDAPTKEKQTILTGSIKVLVDESLEPIVREQLEVFEHSYVHAEIELVIRPENIIVNNLLKDSAEVAVLTRELDSDELKYFLSRDFKPRVTRFATDAIALITNAASPDSTFTVEEIVSIMKGEGRRSLVFDNANSGTVRYLKELAGVAALPQEGVYALNTNPAVIAYVHDHPGVIGVVGINWLVKPDSSNRQMMESIRVLKVKGLPGQTGSDGFYAPSQSNLAERVYPLSRPVYLLNAEPRYGLGMGFAAFLSGDRGQRIVLKSGLMPDSLPPREVIIRKK